MGSDPETDESDGGRAPVAAALWSIPLFNACDRTEIEAASRLFGQRSAAAGTELTAGELASHSFLIVSGQALAEEEGDASTQLVPGDLFGLLGFAAGGRRTVGLVALTPLRLLVADEAASARLLSLGGVARTLVHGAATRRLGPVERRLPARPTTASDRTSPAWLGGWI